MTDIADIATQATLSAEPLATEAFNAVFNSRMTDMIVLDLALALVIGIAPCCSMV